MSRLKTQGFISLQLVLGLMSMQMLFFSAWPSIKTILLSWLARMSLNQLQFELSYLRLMSIIKNRILYLYPISSEHNWALGWRVADDKQILWQKKTYQFVKMEIEWHGFSQHPPLIFYPDGLRNHLNGYFKAPSYRLWVNRLGYSRITDEI